MKVVFNVVLAVAVVDKMIAGLVDAKNSDYYEHVGHAMASRKSAWTEEGNVIKTLMKDVHDDEVERHRPGYFVSTKAVSYCTSNGNTVWIKRLDPQKIEVGYYGARHGMSHMFRIVNNDLMSILEDTRPVLYETSEKGWLWNENRNDAIERITGKSLQDWKEIPVGARASRLSQMDVTKRMTDIVLSL